MISLHNRVVSRITKIVLVAVIVYTSLFIFYKTISYYQAKSQKEELVRDIEIQKNETEVLKSKVNEVKNKIENLEKIYIQKEELEGKIKDIFQRMSFVDFQLNYVDAKKMCVDRYIIVARANYQSEQGLKAVEGILSYLGEIRKSEQDENLYFVNYITKPRDVK
jgi:cell division protein FtsB